MTRRRRRPRRTPRLRARRRRAWRGGLGAPTDTHAHEVGRALVLAERAAGDVSEHVAAGRCRKAFGSLLRARSAIGTAHAHAVTSGLLQAIKEAAATDAIVARATRAFGNHCVLERR